jgi:hypothetical protein
MTAQAKGIDYYLIKCAAVSGMLLLINYLLWSVSAPSPSKILSVTASIISIIFFLANKSPLNYWPIKLFIISLALISLGSPTADWDARSIWLFHAKRIFIENNMYAQLDGYADWSHNDYPVLVPALSATLGEIIGHWNEVFPKLSSVLAFCPAIFILASQLNRASQQILLCLLLMIICTNLLVNGYMDGLLAAYFTAASLLVYTQITEACTAGSSRYQRYWLLFASTVIFAILTLIKNEGLVALIILTAAAMLSSIFSRGARITLPSLACLLSATIPILFWKAACAAHGIRNDLAQSDLISQLTARLYHQDIVFHILNDTLLQRKIIIAAILFAAALLNAGHRNMNLYAAVCASLYFGVLFVVYLSTPYDLTWHLDTSADRTILPVGLILGYYTMITLCTSKTWQRFSLNRA